MYKLERVRTVKIVLGILTLVFLALFLLGYRGGGYEIILDGFMNEPLCSIVMVSSLFSAVVCLVSFFIVNALEKDITEWLGILETKITNKQQ